MTPLRNPSQPLKSYQELKQECLNFGLSRTDYYVLEKLISRARYKCSLTIQVSQEWLASQLMICSKTVREHLKRLCGKKLIEVVHTNGPNVYKICAEFLFAYVGSFVRQIYNKQLNNNTDCIIPEQTVDNFSQEVVTENIGCAGLPVMNDNLPTSEPDSSDDVFPHAGAKKESISDSRFVLTGKEVEGTLTVDEPLKGPNVWVKNDGKGNLLSGHKVGEDFYVTHVDKIDSEGNVTIGKAVDIIDRFKEHPTDDFEPDADLKAECEAKKMDIEKVTKAFKRVVKASTNAKKAFSTFLGKCIPRFYQKSSPIGQNLSFKRSSNPNPSYPSALALKAPTPKDFTGVSNGEAPQPLSGQEVDIGLSWIEQCKRALSGNAKPDTLPPGLVQSQSKINYGSIRKGNCHVLDHLGFKSESLCPG